MKPIILTLNEPITTEMLNNKTFQIHVINNLIIKLVPVEVMEIDNRCPIIIGGEQCGRKVGHEGKHCWLNGD